MKIEYFDIAKLILQIILVIVSVYVAPKLKSYLEQNTTKEQRDNAMFWLKYITKIAEDMYKEKGKGKDKKEFVVEWINRNGIKISKEQLSILIDMVVDEYNKNGWDKELLQ